MSHLASLFYLIIIVCIVNIVSSAHHEYDSTIPEFEIDIGCDGLAEDECIDIIQDYFHDDLEIVEIEHDDPDVLIIEDDEWDEVAPPQPVALHSVSQETLFKPLVAMGQHLKTQSE